jgi:hypothetical protein
MGAWQAQCARRTNHDEFFGPPQPLKHRQTPSGVGCRRSETLPVCPAQPESKSKTAKARSHRIDAPQGGEPTLSSPSRSEPCHAAARTRRHCGLPFSSASGQACGHADLSRRLALADRTNPVQRGLASQHDSRNEAAGGMSHGRDARQNQPKGSLPASLRFSGS